MILSEVAAEQPVIYTRPVVYCMVPADLAGRLHSMLDEWFAHDPGVEVVVERRSGERRADDAGPPEEGERRQSERRSLGVSSTAAAEGWDLPWGARRHAHRLGLVLFDVPVHGRDNAVVERALVERVRCGDGAAADELYARNFGVMHGWAVRTVGRRRAEALTQDIFAEAFARIDDPQLDRRSLDGWLRGGATSVAE